MIGSVCYIFLHRCFFSITALNLCRSTLLYSVPGHTVFHFLANHRTTCSPRQRVYCLCFNQSPLYNLTVSSLLNHELWFFKSFPTIHPSLRHVAFYGYHHRWPFCTPPMLHELYMLCYSIVHTLCSSFIIMCSVIVYLCITVLDIHD